MNNIHKFINELKIYDCGLTKTRLGNQGDGGYVVLEELCQDTKQVITVGVGDDVGFELDFLDKFNPDKILLFDPTIDKIKEDNGKFEFYKLRFNSINIEIPANSLFKVDIEWNEWELFNHLRNGTGMFSQIIIEFHLIHMMPPKNLTPYFTSVYQNACDEINQDLFFNYHNTLRRLNEHFYIYHIHANNSLPKIAIKECVGHQRQRYLIPPLLEMSFVHKDLVDNVRESTTKLPVAGLDFSNKTDRPDIIDWYPIC